MTDNKKDQMFATFSDAMQKYLLEKNPRCQVEIVSVENETAEQTMGTSATSLLTTCKISTKVGDCCKTYHLFRKDMFDDNEIVRQYIMQAQLYQKEVGMYSKWVPFLDEYQKKRQVTPLTMAIPTYYGSEVSEDKLYLILENLGLQGFGVITDRLELSYQEVDMAIRELAKMHALGYAVLSEHGKDRLVEKFPFIGERMYTKQLCSMSYFMFVGCFSGAIEVVSSVDAVVGKKMAKYLDKAFDILLEKGAAQDELFLTVLHGDFWFNNILYKYDKDGLPVDVRFVDFQTIRPASAMIDLTYFLYTSTTRAFRKDHYGDILQTYFDTYVATLKHLDIDLPPKLTLDCLIQKMKDMMLFAVVYMSFAMPMQLAGDPKEASGLATSAPQAIDDNIELPIPELWKEAINSIDDNTKRTQIAMAQNLKKNMYKPNCQKRVVEFYREMNGLGIL